MSLVDTNLRFNLTAWCLHNHNCGGFWSGDHDDMNPQRKEGSPAM